MKKFVLYADDDADDEAWINEAYEAVHPAFSISFVKNGKEVLNYLQPLSEQDLPSLIVLDLNMPELDGKQTLQKLKANPLYRQIPVAIVSTSSNTIDQGVCQRLGAALFLVKPVSFHDWESVIHQLEPLAAF